MITLLKDSYKLLTYHNIKHIHSCIQNNSCNVFKSYLNISNDLILFKLKYIDSFLIQRRCVSTSLQLSARNKNYKEGHGNRILYVPSKKDEYAPEKEMSRIEKFKIGFPMIRSEIKKWKEEMKEKFIPDPLFVRPGDTDIVFDFKNEDDIKKWVVTSDGDHEEGNSYASLTMSPAGHGLFSGFLDPAVTKGGEVKYAGYSNMTSHYNFKSFKRENCYDWESYTHLKMRVRGDGRRYMLLLDVAGFFDVSWHDIYHYMLFTRGGPYWQEVKIPFSKFYYGAKGRVQDKQGPIDLSRVKRFGITCSDRIKSPFRLEIDYIATHCDLSHTEEFAYEMYKVVPYSI